jgi:hypothetical protein
VVSIVVRFLVPHSPDFSPIEGAFSTTKSSLHPIGARTGDSFMEATGKVLDAVSRWDAMGWFGHCNYHIAHHPV